MKASGAGGIVVVFSQGVALFSSVPNGLVSLGVGLIGVALARWVFVNREQRRLGRKERWQETLPLTLTAMLIAGVIIWDRDLGLSGAAFTGLGVGWAAVLLLDVMGERILLMLGGGRPKALPPLADWSGNSGKLLPGDVDVPRDMARKLDELDDGRPK